MTLDVVDDLPEAVQIANTETSALAAGIVAEDVDAVERFFSLYRGSAAFWHASTRYTDGFELTGSPETGINVDWAPGPRGPVTYRDLWLRQYRVVGDGDASSMRIVVKLGSSLVATPKGAVRRGLLAARAREVSALVAGGHSVCIVSSGAIALGGPAPRLRRGGRRRCASCRLRRQSARRSSSRPGSGRSAVSAYRQRRSCCPPATSPTARPTSTSVTPSMRCSGSGRSRS